MLTISLNCQKIVHRDLVGMTVIHIVLGKIVVSGRNSIIQLTNFKLFYDFVTAAGHPAHVPT